MALKGVVEVELYTHGQPKATLPEAAVAYQTAVLHSYRVRRGFLCVCFFPLLFNDHAAVPASAFLTSIANFRDFDVKFYKN